MGNQIRTRDDLEPTIEKVLAFDSVYGVVAILGDAMAAGGDLELVSLSQE
ncbi:MAG: hypothetical protein GWP07_06650 [Xanthomonadaceae bacterium]|nr:hypothetical protein [Xanthomonadaceae bacterium]